MKKFIMKKEANFGIQFRHWVMANVKDLISCGFELKQTATDSIPFNCVEDHQLDVGMTITRGEKGYLARVESGSIGCPDYLFYNNAPSFIVIKFHSGFVLIDIETFILEKKRSKRKSLTWERAKSICWKVIE